MWNYFPLMPVITFIFLIIILCIVIKFFRNSTNKAGNYSKRNDNSITILKERFAKGEITKEQFTEIEKELLR